MDAEPGQPSSPAAAEAIFNGALEVAPAERDAYLARACGDDQKLRLRVEALLRAHDTPERFLPERPGGSRAQITEKPGDRIGPYKLLQKLGEGGCGVVYMAEQEEPVRRKVALKVIKLGMDTKHVVARFEAERQALALMDHPNIAKVLEAGATDAGRPYFVMELVDGLKVTDYCEQYHLDTRRRLDLFIQVCQAVQHAHQKGIIHRDIKPSNVLVAMQDAVPVPKVIDFGIAKATQGKLTDDTVFTAFEQFLGTPAYMSPEQAQLGGMDVDTRSDIYSLGVLLYELLTGKTPFDAKELLAAGLDAMRRTICEKEPPTPSTRLRQDLAAHSGGSDKSTLSSLRSALDKDLDWIVMKCLEKDRVRRYETANGLAMDLQRHLDNEPVLASPPSRLYRLQKLVRRNRVTATATAIVVIVLVLAVVMSSWQAVRATRAGESETRQRKLAQASEQKAISQMQVAEAIRRFLQHDLLRQADVKEQADTLRVRGSKLEVKANPTIKELLERATWELAPERIETKFPGQLEVQASLLETMGLAYHGLNEFGKVEEFFLRAADLSRSASGAEHPVTLRILGGLADAYRHNGKHRQAIELYSQVRDIQLKSLGADHPDTLKTIAGLARAYDYAGECPHATEMLEQIRNAQVKKLGADHRDTLYTMDWLASTYLEAGRYSEAIQLSEQVRDTRSRSLGPDHPETIATMWQLGQAYLRGGKLPEAIEILERTRNKQVTQFGADAPATLQTMDLLGVVYREAGKLPQAIETLEQVREAWAQRLGPDDPGTLNTAACLGVAYMDAKKLPQAIELLEKVRDAQIRKLGSDHEEVLATLSHLASAYADSGRPADAIAMLEHLRGAQTRRVGPDHPFVIITIYNLASAYEKSGNKDQALQLFRQAAEKVEKRKFQDGFFGSVVGGLIGCLERCGQYDEALTWWRKVPEMVRQREGAESQAYADELDALGLKLMERQRLDDALETLGKCLALRERLWPDDWATFGTRLTLGRAFLSQKNYSGAEPLLLSAYEGLSKREARIPPKERVSLNEALSRLVDLYTACSNQPAADKWRQEAERRPTIRLNDEGAIKRWLILAPIPLAPGQTPFDAVTEQQINDEAKLLPRAGNKVSAGGRELVWQEHRVQDSVIDFNVLLGKETTISVAYAVCYVRVPGPQNGVRLSIGSDDEARVYLNGRLVYEARRGRPLTLDEDTVSGLELEAGWNQVVFKVINEQWKWQGSLRFANPDDTPIQGFEVGLDPEGKGTP